MKNKETMNDNKNVVLIKHIYTAYFVPFHLDLLKKPEHSMSLWFIGLE